MGERDFGWIHSNNDAFRPILPIESLKSDYTFVILRNPFSRIVSYFINKLSGVFPFQENDDSGEAARNLFSLPLEALTFEAFIEDLWRNPDKLLKDEHIRPQVDFLLFNDYDDWFCVEDYDSAVMAVREKTGLDVIDTRSLSGHAASSLESVKVEGAEKLNSRQLQEMWTKASLPSPESFCTGGIAVKIACLYYSDIILYSNKIKSVSCMSHWLEECLVELTHPK